MMMDRDSGKFAIKYSASLIWKIIGIAKSNTSKKITLI